MDRGEVRGDRRTKRTVVEDAAAWAVAAVAEARRRRIIDAVAGSSTRSMDKEAV